MKYSPPRRIEEILKKSISPFNNVPRNWKGTVRSEASEKHLKAKSMIELENIWKQRLPRAGKFGRVFGITYGIIYRI